MTKILKFEDIIRYSYGECPQQEAEIIEALIKTNEHLQVYYDGILATQKELNGLNRQPSDEVLKKILEYAKQPDDIIYSNTP
jgi:hypothetical protein